MGMGKERPIMKDSPQGSTLYEFLGVRPIINGAGTRTAVGGSRMRPEVLDAMAEASRFFVDLMELNRAVGRYIAQLTGAEAGMVTGGSASGVVLSMAACMTGTDVAKIRRLPEASTMKNEVAIQKVHRGTYSENYRFAGAKFVDVGTMNECRPEELDGAITDNTAAVAFLISRTLPRVGLTLPEAVAVAHAREVPVIVDAAAMLPPRSNLTRYIKEGADLVVISGGKMIRGPQSSGLLFGRQHLVEAALANSNPNQAIGRPQKVSREAMVGLYVALKLFVEADEEQEYADWRAQVRSMIAAVEELPGLRAFLAEDDVRFPVPMAVIQQLPDWTGRPCEAIASSLLEGEPRVLVIHDKHRKRLVVNPTALQNGESEVLARRLREELERH